MLTTSLFWDCGCTDNYIHPTTTDHCARCGYQRDSADSPDAHIDEVPVFYPEVSIDELKRYEAVYEAYLQDQSRDADYLVNLAMSILYDAGVDPNDMFETVEDTNGHRD